MNIFLTGGTGFIGIALLKEICKYKEIDNVYCIYRDKKGESNPKIIWIKKDLEHLNSIDTLDNIEICIHCASLQNRFGNTYGNILRTNIINTEQIIEFCQKHKIKQFVFYSSINARLIRKGAYAKSKIASEKIVKKSGLNYKIIRPALVFGKGKNGISTLAEYIKKSPIIPVFGDGKKLEQPIFIDDLAELSVKYILDEEKYMDTVEMLGREPMQYNDLIKIIAQVLEIKIRILHIPVVPVVYLLRILELFGLSPVASEQIAHINEDLDGSMLLLYKKYSITPTDFKTGLSYLK